MRLSELKSILFEMTRSDGPAGGLHAIDYEDGKRTLWAVAEVLAAAIRLRDAESTDVYTVRLSELYSTLEGWEE